MSDSPRADPPSAFVTEWATRLGSSFRASPRALDVAAGRGRHSEFLARAGYRVFAVDNNVEAIREARTRVEQYGHQLRGWAADLTRSALPAGAFELIVVTRYLQRDLFPSIREAVSAGGVVVYETFTEAQRALGWGPQSPEHLLKARELRSYFAGFEILCDEEITSPEAVARIVARRL